MIILQQLGYHQAGKSSHSSPTEDASDLHSLYAYHTIQDGMGNPLDPVLYCCKIFREHSVPFLPPSSLHQSPWWRSSYVDVRPTSELTRRARVHGKKTFVNIYTSVLDASIVLSDTDDSQIKDDATENERE